VSEADKRPPRLIFSDEERRQIVRNFVEAYLANEIQLVWPTKEEYEQLAKYGYLSGKFSSISLDTANKTSFNESVLRVTGYKEATYDEVEAAFSEIFDFIINARIGERIKGSFFKGTNVEQRLKDLEDKIASHGRLIESLRMLDHVGGNANDNLP